MTAEGWSATAKRIVEQQGILEHDYVPQAAWFPLVRRLRDSIAKELADAHAAGVKEGLEKALTLVNQRRFKVAGEISACCCNLDEVFAAIRAEKGD